MYLNISLVLFLQLQHFLVTSFPLDMTPRLDGIGLCLSEVENQNCWMVKGSVTKSSENRCQINLDKGNHGKAVSGGTCLTVDDDFSYSVK